MTPDTFAAMQSDTFSLHAQTLLPLLLKHVRAETTQDKEVVELLRRWNYDSRADSAAAAIFEAWFLRLAPTLLEDKLGPTVTRSYERRFTFVTRFVVNMLNNGTSRFCDGCDAIVTAALHDGVATLAGQMGSTVAGWRWDTVHRAVFPHQGLDTVPGLHWLLSRSIPNRGDWSSVNVGAVDVTRPFEQTEIPGYRQIIDLSTANDNRFLASVGQGGHFLSPHYDDLLQKWHDVKHLPMRMDRAAIESHATGRLRLVPPTPSR